MRAYFFVNSALSPMQKGIQVAHCLTAISNNMSDIDRAVHYEEIRSKEPDADERPWKPSSELIEASLALRNAYFDWAKNHKTIVVLEGGFHQDLRWIESYFKCGFKFRETSTLDPSPYPWAAFCEDEETMNGMMTCIGIIVPSKIYEIAKAIRESSVAGVWDQVKEKEFTSWELSFIELLNSCPLAH